MNVQKLLLSLLVLFVIGVTTSAQTVRFEHISAGIPLGNISKNAICQDNEGMIWIGTRQGLYSYDGIHLERHNPVATADDVPWVGIADELCVGMEGNLFLLTDRFLTVRNHSTQSYMRNEKQYLSTLTAGKNVVWGAYQNQLFTCSDKEISIYYSFESSVLITAIFELADGSLMVGTNDGVIYNLDANRKVNRINALSSPISVFYQDAAGALWVGTQTRGVFVYCIDGTTHTYNTLSTISLSDNFVRDICQDDSGTYWIGTIKGLDRIAMNQSIHYATSASTFEGLINPSVWGLFKDRQGSIWIGTYFGGIYRLNPRYERFRPLVINHSGMDPQLLLSQVLNDAEGNFWIASEGNGLLLYRPSNESFKWFREGAGRGNLPHNNIKSLTYDKPSNTLWISMHMGGLARMDCRTHQIIPISSPNFPDLGSYIFRTVVRYKDTYYAASHNGLFAIDAHTYAVERFGNAAFEQPILALQLEDDKLWIAATTGIWTYNLAMNKSISLSCSEVMRQDLMEFRTTNFYRDSRGDVWLGSETHGLYKFNKQMNTFEILMPGDSHEQILSAFSINETSNGYLLVATEKGLLQIDVATNKWFFYTPKNDFLLLSMSPGGIYTDATGLMILTGINGAISTSIEKMQLSPQENKVRFQTLYVNNDEVEPDDEHRILDQTLSRTQRIALANQYNHFKIRFASDNYILSGEICYQYFLEGFDNEWMVAPHSRELSYMNLPAGSYTLHIRSIASLTGKVLSEESLDIRIRPPFYTSWWAIIVYILLLISAIWSFVRFRTSRIRLESSLQVERKEKEQNELTTQSKLRFFTNISHEFRTPITLILGQLQMLLESTSVQPAIYNRILTVYKNASKMQQLISELLDFRKQEQGFLKLKVSEQNIIAFVYDVYSSFREYSNLREINFSFNTSEEQILVWVDSLQLQKVFNNLISNAFKYTHKGGNISIDVARGERSAVINIMDSGIGVSPDDMERIFDRFYQVENISATNVNVGPGTGIGLALAKGIVEMHGGTISVKSGINQGSLFTVELPLGFSHLEGNPNISRSDTPLSVDSLTILELTQGDVPVLTPREEELEKEHSLLLVEDNVELRAMLSELFSGFFNVITAENGEEGLYKAQEFLPDLVVSDVMMPLLSGSEMCAKLKASIDTCHIPVVLLTAQTTIEQTIEGLKTGADDYITKPFNTQMLLTRCHNLIQNKRLMREKYCREVAPSPTIITSSALDQKFLEEAIAIVEANFYNDSFDVKLFARKMSMGLTNFYAKLKGVTGQTPNGFIQMIKLRKAAALLRSNPELNISEVGYQLGFCNPKYFTRCFKEQFGITPTAYKDGQQGTVDL